MTNPVTTKRPMTKLQELATKEDGLPAFLARQPGEAPAKPSTAPKVPTKLRLGEPEVVPGMLKGKVAKTPEVTKTAKKVEVTKLPPAVAEGAYANGAEAKAKTGIDKARKAAGGKVEKKVKATKERREGEPRGKGAIVIDLLSRKQGATKEELRKATGWTIKSIASSIPSAHRGRYTITTGERGKKPCYFAAPKKHRSK